jgi:hypothetical protein
MFDFVSTLTASANPKDALVRANFAVQDKLGKFMSLGARVIALRDKSKADAGAFSRGNSLLNGITVIQTRALSVLGQATDLQEKLVVKNIWDIKGVDRALLAQAASIVKNLYAINADMDAHTKKVDAYASLVSGLPVGSSGNKVLPWGTIAASLGILGLIAYAGRGK